MQLHVQLQAPLHVQWWWPENFTKGGIMPEFETELSCNQLPGAEWRKSGRSNPKGNCVELAELGDGSIAVRNSRNPNGAALLYTRPEIIAFIQGAKDGDFDDLLG